MHLKILLCCHDVKSCHIVIEDFVYAAAGNLLITEGTQMDV